MIRAVSELLSGDAAPRRFGAAIVAATLVTLVAAVPLTLVSLDARRNGPASSQGLVLDRDAGREDLAGLEISETDEPGRLVVDVDDTIAVTWALYEADGNLVREDRALAGPPFVLDESGGLIDELDDGIYELLVSGTQSDGSTVQRAARFAVGELPSGDET